MDHKVVIWQDSQDSYMYHIGVEGSSGIVTTWTTIFIDGIFDLFGSDVYNTVRENVYNDTVEIKLSMEFVDSDA